MPNEYDNDLAPLFFMKKTIPIEEEDDEDEQEYVKIENEKPKSEDYFEPFTKRLQATQTEEVRKAITNTPCFGKLWYSSEDRSFCSETECSLKTLCEYTYDKVIDSLEAKIEIKKEKTIANKEEEYIQKMIESRRKRLNKLDDRNDFLKLTPYRKLNPDKRGRKKGAQIKNLTRIVKDRDRRKSRSPYIYQNRSIDKLARQLFEALKPVFLPDDWYFKGSRNEENRETERIKFVSRYGNGFAVIKRRHYHQYFHNGTHVCRFWLRCTESDWIDMAPDLTKIIEAKKYKTVVSPKVSLRQMNLYFNKRIKIATRQGMNIIINSIRECVKNRSKKD